MKKMLIAAAAAAAFVTPVMAQSSVTLYGRLNMSTEYQKIGGGDAQGDIRSNSSYIGFKGVEDLGGGLKAGFNLQHGLSADTGTQTSSRFWNRESELFLAGNWGKLRLGAWTPETYLGTADYISMHNHDAGTSADAFYYDNFAVNKVGYQTPQLGSFVGELSVNEGSGTTGGDKGFNASGTMAFGPMGIGLGYSQGIDGYSENKQVALRLTGEFGGFVLGGYYQRATDIDWGNRNSFRVSAMYTMGNTELHANVGKASAWSDWANTDAMQYTLGVNHNLSKRTKIYAFYTAINNNSQASYSTVGPVAAGADFQSFALGVRHNF